MICFNTKSCFFEFRNVHLNDVKVGGVSSCNAKCRQKLACNLDYAVNEFTVLCLGYNFDFFDTRDYFLGVLEDPWVDLF